MIDETGNDVRLAFDIASRMSFKIVIRSTQTVPAVRKTCASARSPSNPIGFDDGRMRRDRIAVDATSLCECSRGFQARVSTFAINARCKRSLRRGLPEAARYVRAHPASLLPIRLRYRFRHSYARGNSPRPWSWWRIRAACAVASLPVSVESGGTPDGARQTRIVHHAQRYGAGRRVTGVNVAHGEPLRERKQEISGAGNRKPALRWLGEIRGKFAASGLIAILGSNCGKSNWLIFSCNCMHVELITPLF